MHTSKHTPEEEPGKTPGQVDEDIRQGLVYPPPPAFYQQQAPTAPVGAPQPATPPPTQLYTWPAPPASYAPQGQEQPQWTGATPTYVMSLQPAKKSYAWIWILVCSLLIIIFSSCGFCAWFGYTYFGSSIRQSISISDAGENQVRQYFAALQDKDYAHAYTYLHPQGTTAEQFIQQAQQEDEQHGGIQSYTIVGTPEPIFSNSSDVAGFTIIVQIARVNEAQYSAHLTLHTINGQWKITDFDKL